MVERIEQLAAHALGERIEPLGTIQRDREDRVLDGIKNLLVVHGIPLCRSKEESLRYRGNSYESPRSVRHGSLPLVAIKGADHPTELAPRPTGARTQGDYFPNRYSDW